MRIFTRPKKRTSQGQGVQCIYKTKTKDRKQRLQLSSFFEQSSCFCRVGRLKFFSHQANNFTMIFLLLDFFFMPPSGEVASLHIDAFCPFFIHSCIFFQFSNLMKKDLNYIYFLHSFEKKCNITTLFISALQNQRYSINGHQQMISSKKGLKFKYNLLLT